MREIVHIQAGQCGNQIGAKVGQCFIFYLLDFLLYFVKKMEFIIYASVKINSFTCALKKAGPGRPVGSGV